MSQGGIEDPQVLRTPTLLKKLHSWSRGYSVCKEGYRQENKNLQMALEVFRW